MVAAGEKLTPELAAWAANYGRAWARSRRLSLELTEDTAADAQLAAVLLAREWDPTRGVPLEVWVRLYLRRRLIDLIRARLGRGTTPRPREVPLAHLPDLPAPADPAVGIDLEDLLTRARPLELEVLERLAAGDTQREAAAELGITDAAVSRRLSGFRARLHRDHLL